jgi:hypothetical protein
MDYPHPSHNASNGELIHRTSAQQILDDRKYICTLQSRIQDTSKHTLESKQTLILTITKNVPQSFFGAITKSL